LNFRLSSRAIVAIAVVIVVIIGGTYLLLGSATQVNLKSAPSKFTVSGKTFEFTYVATNETEWQAGLMNKKVTSNTTMLFVFPNSAVYPFWMYHVNSSLDIIWLQVTGGEGDVVYLAASVPGCFLPIGCPNYTPTSAANYVIEAQGGFCELNGIGLGTQVRFG